MKNNQIVLDMNVEKRISWFRKHWNEFWDRNCDKKHLNSTPKLMSTLILKSSNGTIWRSVDFDGQTQQHKHFCATESDHQNRRLYKFGISRISKHMPESGSALRCDAFCHNSNLKTHSKHLQNVNSVFPTPTWLFTISQLYQIWYNYIQGAH